MNNCYVCGANLGIYSRGTALDKREKYVLCSKCYWGVMSFHKSLHKISSLEELDKLEEKLDHKISSGKLKDRQVEAIKVCYEERRKELKVQIQMLEQYEMSHNPAYKVSVEQAADQTTRQTAVEETEEKQFDQLNDREKREEMEIDLAEQKKRADRELSKITTADTLGGMTVQKYLGPISVQQIIPVSTVEQEAEFSRIKQEAALKLLLEAKKSGGEGVIGLKYSLTPMGTDRMLLMADGTSVK